MTYKEFKYRINKIADDYGLNLTVTEDTKNIYVKVGSSICGTVKKFLQFFMSVEPGAVFFSLNERQEILKALYELSKTSIKERQEEKRYIIPLPDLVTTDGEQQYLTHKGSFFASRRDKKLRQTWKEKHLKYVPEEYRKYAVEVEDDIRRV